MFVEHQPIFENMKTKYLFSLAVISLAFAGCNSSNQDSQNSNSGVDNHHSTETVAADTNVKSTGAGGVIPNENGKSSTTAPGTNGSGVGSGANGSETKVTVDTNSTNTTSAEQ